MPRKRYSNLSQRSNSARAMKVARFNETLPQAELRRLRTGVSVMQLTELLRHQSGPKLGDDFRQNIWHLNGLLRHTNSPKLGVFSMQLTWRLREIYIAIATYNFCITIIHHIQPYIYQHKNTWFQFTYITQHGTRVSQSNSVCLLRLHG
ncbi:hypothetical protein TNCV_3776341 [Trichonephila clavipes]|nr:hypothetical protein TNCV_3776341 [Trichonephila clavipes]